MMMDLLNIVNKILESEEDISEANFENRCESILKLASVDPCSLAYSNIRKYLGAIKFKKGDIFGSSYNFQESLGPTLRTYANKVLSSKILKTDFSLYDEKKLKNISNILETNILKNDPLLAHMQEDVRIAMKKNLKSSNCESEAKRINFIDTLSYKYINSSESNSMKLFNEGLPAEWTIVQITKASEITDMIGPLNHCESSAPVYFTLFSGDHVNIKDHKPITICVKPSLDTKYILTELLTVLRNYESDVKKTRSKFCSVYKRLLFEFEEYFGGIASLFLGKFKSDTDDYVLICREVDDCINEHKLTLSYDQRILLYKLAAYSTYACSFESVNYALQAILPNPEHGEVRKIILSCFRKMLLSEETNHKNIENAERWPTILIVDQALDLIPWEVLRCFERQSVTRIHSLHLLHALYYMHKDHIRNGYFMVDKIKGGYILDHAQDLSSMVIRIKSFLRHWLPNWTCGISDNEPTAQDMANILRNNTIFYYAGHGGGQKFLPYEVLEIQDISCIAILSGCSSVSSRRLGLGEEYGLHLSYHIAGSPCVIGNLWSVSDKDCDTVMSRLISTWVPGPKNVKHFIHCNLSKWDQGEIDDSTSINIKGFHNYEGPVYPDILSEPDLQKAVAISRGYSMSIMNKCSLVARGLPTKLKF